MPRLAALAAVVLLATSACGSGSTKGGSGVVTAGRIGSLRIDVSTRRAIVAFAGKPDFAASGAAYLPPGLNEAWFHVVAYGCPPMVARKGVESVSWSSGCETAYYVNDQTARLAAFYTKSPDFHTTNGIEPGTEQNVADSLEHQTPHGAWGGLGVSSKSARLILPSFNGKVRSFILESNDNPIGLIESVS